MSEHAKELKLNFEWKKPNHFYILSSSYQTTSIRINQLPVFVTRWWQPGSRYDLNFKLVKNHKIANDSITTKAKDKNKHRFGILKILEIFWYKVD